MRDGNTEELLGKNEETNRQQAVLQGGESKIQGGKLQTGPKIQRSHTRDDIICIKVGIEKITDKKGRLRQQQAKYSKNKVGSKQQKEEICTLHRKAHTKPKNTTTLLICTNTRKEVREAFQIGVATHPRANRERGIAGLKTAQTAIVLNGAPKLQGQTTTPKL